MRTIEPIYLTRDNSAEAILKEDGVAVDTSPFTKMTLSFGRYMIESTNLANGPIRWNRSGYRTGEVRFVLGSLIGISKADYVNVPLVVYKAEWPDGLVWTLLRFLAERV